MNTLKNWILMSLTSNDIPREDDVLTYDEKRRIERAYIDGATNEEIFSAVKNPERRKKLIELFDKIDTE